MSDNVTNPKHYTQYKIQPIEFFRANREILSFEQCNVIKYVCRYEMKNGREDLMKAKQYLDWLIEQYDKDNPPITGQTIRLDPRLYPDQADMLAKSPRY